MVVVAGGCRVDVVVNIVTSDCYALSVSITIRYYMLD